MKFILSFLLLFSTVSVLLSQEVINQDTLFNQTDEIGMKQGHWKKHYPNGNLMYQGFFIDDRPSGLLNRYFEDGTLKATMEFYDQGSRSRARIYYQGGGLAAEGNFIGSDKDSTWRYYSYYNNSLSSIERYEKGVLNGTQEKFYSNGQLLESLNWSHGKKHGNWLRYYDNGQVLLKSTYDQDVLNGIYLMFNPDATPIVHGRYKSDLKEGVWKYYDDQGQFKFEIEYIDGIATNQEELDKNELEYLDSLEKKKGTIPEPTLEDLKKK